MGSDLYGAHVHGLLHNVIVIMQAKSLHIHGLVEGPGVGVVLLGKHFLQDGVAVLEALGQLGPLGAMVVRLGRVGQVFPRRLDGPATAAPGNHLQRLGVPPARR